MAELLSYPCCWIDLGVLALSTSEDRIENQSVTEFLAPLGDEGTRLPWRPSGGDDEGDAGVEDGLARIELDRLIAIEIFLARRIRTYV